MSEMERLLVRIEASTAQFETQMRRVNRVLYGTQAETRKTMARMQAEMARASQSMFRPLGDALRSEVAGLGAILAGAFSAQAIVGLADSFTQMQNRLKVTGLEAQGLSDQFAALNAVADASRSPIEAVVAVYSRLRLATEGMGYSNEQVTRTTEILSKALKASGATAAETAAALLQFGQGIGSGALQGDELRSIRENAPAVARAIAAEFGVTVGELKKLGEEGKLTSDRVVAAVLASGAAIDGVFAKTEATVGDALTNLRNRLVGFIGQTDEALGASERMAQAIQFLADNLDTLGNGLVVISAALAGNLAGRGLATATAAFTAARAEIALTNAQLAAFELRAGLTTGALGRMTVAGRAGAGAMNGLNKAMAFMGGPIGLAVTALAAGIVTLGLSMQEAEEQGRYLNEATQTYNDLTARAAELTNASAAANKGIQSTANSATGAINAMCDATEDLANQTYRLADANMQAWRTDALRQVAANRDEIRQLSKFSPLDLLPTGPGGMPAIEGKNARRAELERQNANLTAQMIGMWAGGGTTFTTGTPGRAGGGAGGGRAGGGRAGAGDAERQAARRAELEIEGEIVKARAAGDEAAIRAAEERQRLARLTADYESAGYVDAAARAAQHLAWENQASDLAERRQVVEAAIMAMAEGTAEATANLVRSQEAAADAAMERLAFEVELARLSGDATLPAKERQLWVEERINELLRERPGLTAGEAQGQAESEYDRLRAADIVGGLGISDPAADRAAAMEEVARLREQDLLSEEQAAQRKAQIDADYWSKRTQNTRAALDALAGLQNSSNSKLAAIGKAAAIAQATMDGVLAVQNALARVPYPLNFVAAAAVGAAAAANVAQIAGMADGGEVRGVGGPREDNQLRWLSVGEFVNNAASVRKNRPYLEAANRGADLGKLLPGMADGGMVGDMGRRVSALAAGMGASRSQPVSLTFAPVVDARGSDLGVLKRIERTLADQEAGFRDRVLGVVGRRDRYALGRRGRP